MSQTVPKTMKTLLLVFVSFLQLSTTPSTTSSAIPVKMNIETNDFKSLVLNNDVFVDKSLLIEEFMQLELSNFIPLMIRPPGWGKSTNLDMLKRFFEIEVDNKGNRLVKNKTINDKLFLGGDINTGSNVSKKLNPLKISYLPSCSECLGTIPVILLKLENVTGKCYRDIEQSLKLRVIDAFRSHSYLFNYTHNLKTMLEGRHIRNYFNGDFNTTELKRSLFTLSGFLYSYFRKQKVVILIDDYDAPLTNAFLNFGNNQKEYDKVVDLLDSMFKLALKNNTFLHKALVTGTMRIDTDSIQTTNSSRPNLNTFTFHYQRFSKYFGFTRSEVQDLLDRISSDVDSVLINSWYGGYDIDGKIYSNERLVMRCLSHNGSIDYYNESDITESPHITKIFAADKMQPKIHSLILGQKLDIEGIFHTSNTSSPLLNELAVLLHYGYLNKSRSFEAPKVAIPNKQMQRIYEMKVLKWVINKFGINETEFSNFAELLTKGAAQKFGTTWRKYLSNAKAAKFLEGDKKQPKVMHDAIMIALQAALWSTHERFEFNRSDRFILIPKLGRSNAAIIFGYKVAKTVDEMKMISTAKSGHDEICRWHNETPLNNYAHINDFYKFSLAFCGAHCVTIASLSHPPGYNFSVSNTYQFPNSSDASV